MPESVDNILTIVLIAGFAAFFIGVIIAVAKSASARKQTFGERKEALLNKLGSSVDSLMQSYLNEKNSGVNVTTAEEAGGFAYKNQECACIIVKFKTDADNDWHVGIISDSGTITKMEPYSSMTAVKAANRLLQSIYKDKHIRVNADALNAFPEVKNSHKAALGDGEKVVFNAVLPMFGTEDDLMLGSKVKFTMTNKRLVLNNGAGIWTVDLYEDIAEFIRDEVGKNLFIRLMLSNMVVFGNDGDRQCTGFRFYFKKADIDKFEDMMNKILDK